MTEADLVIRSGTIYADSGIVDNGEVVVRDGKIVAINSQADHTVQPRRVLDAKGCLVIPGAIDTHSHHRDPGFTHKEDITTATTAAALGGVTMSVGMPNVDPPTNSPERYQELIRSQSARAVVDFNHNPAPTDVSSVAELAKMGALGFKVYMVVDSKRQYPHMPGLGVHDHGHLLEICEAVKATGRVLMVHPNDQQILKVLEERAWASGDYSYRNYAYSEAALDGVVWNAAVSLLLELQRVTGVALHVLHMMNPRMIQLIASAKEAGNDVTSEVNPFALFLSDLDVIDHLGPLALGRCVPQDWVKDLWSAVEGRTIDVLGSDHAPHTFDEKSRGWSNMWETPSGTPQLQHYLPRLLTAAKAKLITVSDVVRLTSTNPARRFGLYPMKGAIRVGSDADIVITDLNSGDVVRGADVASRAGYTPYEGEILVAIPKCTVLRGTIIAENGKVLVEPGFGNFVPPVGAPASAADVWA